MLLLPSPRSVAPSWRRPETWLIAATLAAVGWFYYWTVATAGGFGPAGDADYFNLLVRGFRKGHLYLDQAPAPEMLKLADPYDPVQNGPYRLPDATYFGGHYYLYFGAVPAVVLMWPYMAITGTEMSTSAAVFVFCLAGFLTASGLWLAIRRRYFPASAAWTAVAGILILDFATHGLALVRRPSIYELPIAAGYAFTMLALVAIYAAVHGRRPVLGLAAAGLGLGLAAGSRPPAMLGAAMLLPVFWWAWREKKTWRWRGAAAAVAGLGLCGAAMLAHNYARFGNALEFGQNYQLTSARELSNRHFGLDYMGHNFAVYYFWPVQWGWEFPFVSESAPSSTISGYAGSEEMAGLLVTLPFLWVALALPLAWRARKSQERRTLVTMLGAIAGLYVGVGVFLLAFFSTTERYLAEFAPALALLAVCGWLGLERSTAASRWRAGAVLPAMVVAVATVVMGVLLSFDYHGRIMSRDDPPTWARLARRSHKALSWVGYELGQFDGVRVLKVRFVPRPNGSVETFWQSADARAVERIVVEHIGERELRFGYARGDAPVVWGRPLTWEPGHMHTVELELPSLQEPPHGFMRGLRANDAFRDRSRVRVWFSGGLALSVRALPLAPGLIAGGAVDANFSGEAHHAGSRMIPEDDYSPPTHLAEPRGGRLRLRVVLATPLAAEGEPLLATGALYGSDIVFVRPAGEGLVQFAFDHFNTPLLVGAPQRLDAGVEHVIEITLPSCPVGERFSGAATGEMSVRMDGADMLRGHTECYAFGAGDEVVGHNPFGTTCGREFRGWLLEAGWTGGATR